MARDIIWSNMEVYPYLEDNIENYKKLGLLERGLWYKPDLEKYISFMSESNLSYLKTDIKKLFSNVVLEGSFVGFFKAKNQNNQIEQGLILLGKTLDSIFDIPFDKATFYTDSWNIKADIIFGDKFYSFTFRTLKPERDFYEISKKLSRGSMVLTSTYMGSVSKTVKR